MTYNNLKGQSLHVFNLGKFHSECVRGNLSRFLKSLHFAYKNKQEMGDKNILPPPLIPISVSFCDYESDFLTWSNLEPTAFGCSFAEQLSIITEKKNHIESMVFSL